MATDLKTLFIGRNLLSFHTIDSTNSYALSLLAGPRTVPEGTAILAEEQRAGRGQALTQWISEPGKNLLVSFVLYPHFLEPQHIFRLSQCVSLAVRDTLAAYCGEDIRIKWPNDVYHGDRKICGMLIENAVRSLHVSHSVAGMGINVNQRSFPATLPNPVSLYQVLGKETDLTGVFHRLCNNLECRYLQLKGGRHAELKDDYLSVMYRFGAPHEFEYGGRHFSARITDVGDDGKLVLDYGNNLVGRYDFKTIRFVI